MEACAKLEGGSVRVVRLVLTGASGQAPNSDQRTLGPSTGQGRPDPSPRRNAIPSMRQSGHATCAQTGKKKSEEHESQEQGDKR